MACRACCDHPELAPLKNHVVMFSFAMEGDTHLFVMEGHIHRIWRPRAWGPPFCPLSHLSEVKWGLGEVTLVPGQPPWSLWVSLCEASPPAQVKNRGDASPCYIPGSEPQPVLVPGPCRLALVMQENCHQSVLKHAMPPP